MTLVFGFLVSLIGFLEVLAFCIVVLIALAVALVFLILKLPPTHPMRALLIALGARLGASAGATALAPVVAGAPVVGEISDGAVLLAVLYFWLTFFWKLYLYLRSLREPRPDVSTSAPPYVAPPPTSLPPAPTEGNAR